ncbi:glutathione S-transferase C-terminal-like protein [Epithele typhae]|uniref:glutathione S-transferase C-terminal-like protein n=1 Tax=Epithele typhae TaxID=378194 RepID=UPI00200844B4|nr:glutathione S-transferase C-terminal-like protein [Epithele typhae]KAH9926306.1 glutathione S-transferase C-terminal-like protein [Epithele typhae]
MSSPKPHFTLFSAIGPPPNPWKVVMILEELGLEYESIYLDTLKGDQKLESHTKYNPNGRVPSLVDHKNNDFVVWESCAIIEYLVEKYDTERKISFAGFEDRILLSQWLFFQASGQGPYFGQAGWFTFYHHEKIPSAIERYRKEIVRVIGVLDATLATRQWLVGDKPSAADLSFIVWNYSTMKYTLAGWDGLNVDDFPHFKRWHNELLARPAVAKTIAMWEEKRGG